MKTIMKGNNYCIVIKKMFFVDTICVLDFFIR